MRAEAIAKAYEATADRLPGVSRRAFAQALAGADVHPVTVGGECVGAVVVVRHEVHACVLPSVRGRWFKREHLRILDGVLQRFGVAMTTATTQAGREFVERLGFRQFGNVWLKGLQHGH